MFSPRPCLWRGRGVDSVVRPSMLPVDENRGNEFQMRSRLAKEVQASRLGRDAFARGEEGLSARRKGWGQFPGHVSRNPKGNGWT